MKKMLAILLVVSSLTIIAKDVPRFSAFSDGKYLHITILGDSCNAFGGELAVSRRCQKSRAIENYAASCKATLSVIATEMFCNDPEPVPRIISLELSKTQIAYEATTLILTYGDTTIDVSLDGKN